ncbi:hypothetical protein CBS63078_8319 [Aspergillus niger]|nr:hypothetical protein CBS63078_8319 [Aspergillus niger]
MIDHIRNGPSADWIPLNSQSDGWDSDKFWKSMNEALSLANEPATSVPDSKESPKTPARARLVEGEDAASASQEENDHHTSRSLETPSPTSAPQHSASDVAQVHQEDSLPSPEIGSRSHTGQDSTPVDQQQSQRYRTTPVPAGAGPASTIQYSLSQAADEQSVTPAQLLTPTPQTQPGVDPRCTAQAGQAVGLPNLQYQYSQSTVGYPAIAGTDHATAFESSNRPGPQWNVTGLTTMPATLNQRMATVPVPFMIPTAWQLPQVLAAQGQGAYMSPAQLTLGCQHTTGPSQTESSQNVHWPNGPFTGAGAEDYTTQPYFSTDVNQPLQ